MFQQTRHQSKIASAYNIAELIFHATVRKVRSGHSNAIIALLTNVLQAVILIAAFYIFFTILGLKGAKLRGDFLLYVMSGIFLFITHVKAVSTVAGAENSTSQMMQHAPMNTMVALISAGLSALYLQFLSLFLVLYIYHAAVTPVVIDQFGPALGMFILAWATGCAVGLVLYALKPWFPTFVQVFTTVYQRANMIASGKMFVANALPPMMLAMFDWNPLFHIIDQSRGFVFNNYFPRNSNWEYPLMIGAILFVIGMMG
jgi:ABC-type polysaccharide/polyol phosphate export permease